MAKHNKGTVQKSLAGSAEKARTHACMHTCDSLSEMGKMKNLFP